MSTIVDMINRIVSELARPDLSIANDTNATRVRAAIATAISAYQGTRFRFSEANNAAPFQFNTVGGQSVYTSNDAAWISTMFLIDYMDVAVGNIWTPMSRRTPHRVHLDILPNNVSQSFPSEYAYEGEALIFYPVPDQPYPIRVGGHYLVAAPASDIDAVNPWVNDVEPMIRSRAKYELAVHVLRNPTLADLYSPEEGPAGTTGRIGETRRWFNEFTRQTSKIVGRSRIRPMRW